MLKRILFGAAALVAFSLSVAPVANAEAPSDVKPQGTIYMGTYNMDQYQQCMDDGAYMVYVAHYQGATGYTCDAVYSMPPNTPQCPYPNPDGCIGTWYNLNLYVP